MAHSVSVPLIALCICICSVIRLLVLQMHIIQPNVMHSGSVVIHRHIMVSEAYSASAVLLAQSGAIYSSLVVKHH